MITSDTHPKFWRALDVVGFCYASSLSLFLLLHFSPKWPEEDAYFAFSALSLGTSVLLIWHLACGLGAFPILFGRPECSKSLWRSAWYLMIGLSIASCVSAFAPFTLPPLFMIYAVVFIFTRLYSIENILIQNALFHLALGHLCSWSCFGLDAHQVSAFQISALWAFFISLGLIMHSAGWEKAKSAIWQYGQGASAFFAQKHLINPSFAPLISRLPIFMAFLMSYAVIIAELALLPSLLWSPLLTLVVLILGGFALSLFTITDLSFIGQNLFCQFVVLAFLNLKIHTYSDVVISLAEGGKWIFAASLLTTAFAIHFGHASEKFGIKKIQHFLSGIAMPIQVFTEVHLKGLMIYRFDVTSKVSDLDVPQVFSEDGTPGKLQRLTPRYFQSCMYLIARIYRKYQRGEVLTDKEHSFLLDLLYAAVPSRLRNQDATVRLMVAPAGSGAPSIPDWKLFAQTTYRQNRMDDLLLQPL